MKAAKTKPEFFSDCSIANEQSGHFSYVTVLPLTAHSLPAEGNQGIQPHN